MGSCVSVHKNPESAMKLRWSIGSKTDSVLIESPNKEHTASSQQLKPQSSPVPPLTSFRDLSSKEEMFFDSHPWLESDCEDFFSVNGDLTPSRGNTPIHQSSFIETPQLDKSLYRDTTANSILEPSPTDKKKKLVELFREGFGSDPEDGGQTSRGTESFMANGRPKQTILDLPSKSTIGTPCASVANSFCSSELTPSRVFKPENGKSPPSVHCCLPSFVRSLSFNDRKKRLNPAHSGGV